MARTDRNAGRGRRRGALTAGAAAVVLAVVAGGSACSAPDRAPARHGTAAPGPVAASPAPPTYLAECLADELTQRPTSYTLACADGNASLDQLTWSGWGEPTATARGVVVSNTCDPDCANGALRRDEATAVASGLRPRGSVRLYTKVTVTYPGTVPEGVPRVETWEAPY